MDHFPAEIGWEIWAWVSAVRASGPKGQLFHNRPKGPAVLPARVVGPGGASHHHTIRPNGPTVLRTARAMRGIVGPLGRHMSLGVFPGPMGRAGGTAGPLGRIGPDGRGLVWGLSDPGCSLPIGAGVVG